MHTKKTSTTLLPPSNFYIYSAGGRNEHSVTNVLMLPVNYLARIWVLNSITTEMSCHSKNENRQMKYILVRYLPDRHFSLICENTWRIKKVRMYIFLEFPMKWPT